MDAEIKSDWLLSLKTRSGGEVQLLGSKNELINFKKEFTASANRHKFIEIPHKLLTYNPALEEVTVMPIDVGVIILIDQTKKSHLKSKIVGAIPMPQSIEVHPPMKIARRMG